MGLFNDRQRALPEILMTDQCSILRMTRTKDATTGGWSESPSVFASAIPCRVDKRELSSRERLLGDRISAVDAVTVMLSAVPSRWPNGVVDVLATDRFTVTGEATGTYEPAGAGGPTTSELVREVPCYRVS